MITPFGLIALTFCDVVKSVRTTFETFFDRRTEKNTNYTMTAAGLSAFLKSPSFLDFQRTEGGNNAQTLTPRLRREHRKHSDTNSEQHGRVSRYGRRMIISIDDDRLQFEVNLEQVNRIGLKLSALCCR